jgi:hypothetical protein
MVGENIPEFWGEGRLSSKKSLSMLELEDTMIIKDTWSISDEFAKQDLWLM